MLHSLFGRLFHVPQTYSRTFHMASTKCHFRCWVFPTDGDPAEWEVFFPDLKPTDSQHCVQDWVKQVLQDYCPRDTFKLVGDDQHFQVVGVVVVSTHYDPFDMENDLDVAFENVKIAKVPDEYFGPYSGELKLYPQEEEPSEIKATDVQVVQGCEWVCTGCNASMTSLADGITWCPVCGKVTSNFAPPMVPTLTQKLTHGAAT